MADKTKDGKINRYTNKSIFIVLTAAVGFGLLMGLARIHLEFLANINDLMFSLIVGGVAGAFSPLILKKKNLN